MIEKSDIEKTKHYTKLGDFICGNLLQYIPKSATIVEPFVGDGDLVALLPDNKWELYDIEKKENAIQQDTLKNPPNYRGKYIFTNPPFLAKNKAKNKELFSLYEEDDLYKIFLSTILECEGGIVILPTNFFTDERSERIRMKFFSIFKVVEANFFSKPVFPTTTYTVCSFFFQKKEEWKKENDFLAHFPYEKQSCGFQLKEEYGYRLGGEFYVSFNKENMFSRLTEKEQEGFITKMKLIAIDTRTEPFHLELNEEAFIGKDTDRTYATLISKCFLTEEKQKEIVEKFNLLVEEARERYHNLLFTNYRDFNRKRIGFDLAYRIASYVCNA